MSSEELLKKKNFKEISDRANKTYNNFILESVNAHCLRMSVMQGDYKWHYHQDTDEVFIVLEGELKIEIKGGQVLFLEQGDFINIPAGTIHKTSAATRTVNLTFEKSGEDTIFVDDIAISR